MKHDGMLCSIKFATERVKSVRWKVVDSEYWFNSSPIDFFIHYNQFKKIKDLIINY